MQKHTTKKPLNQNKMKNIHILPTDKPSRLWINNLLQGKLELNEEALPFNTSQHIYITSDEEIKEEDWFYNTISLKPEPFKACENGDGYVNCSRYSHYRIDCKKIILTTDQDLIADGVQAIDDEFLEWFVNNPSCEEVEVEFIEDNWGYYKIIIPKEEPTEEAKQRAANYMSLKGALEPKQETLEEVADNMWLDPMKNLTSKMSFIAGAKWQQERSDIEANKIIEFLDNETKLKISDTKTIERIKWYFETYFEQFKTK